MLQKTSNLFFGFCLVFLTVSPEFVESRTKFNLAELKVESEKMIPFISNDSLENAQTLEDLERIKAVLELTREKEADIFQILLTKNHFLNNPIISDQRANLTLESYRKEFESILEIDEIEDLNNSGLIEEIFRKKSKD
jgi:hypothetical protein